MARTLCADQCAGGLVAVQGVCRASLLQAELLLLLLMDRKAVSCPGRPPKGVGEKDFFLISDFAAGSLSSKLSLKQALQAIRDEILEAAQASLQNVLYEKASKSLLFKLPTGSIIPFIPPEEDVEQGAEASRREETAVSKENAGAEKRKKILISCVRDWRQNLAEQKGREFKLEALPLVFLGQELAVQMVTNPVKNRLGGWGRRDKPLVIAFLGPSGTGKTELARQLAAILHEDHPNVLLSNKKFVQIPMGQYKDENSAANLVGPPVGIEGTGQLTGALLKNPNAVVLFDEFEKAHPQAIPDVLLSAFDNSGAFKDTKLDRYVPTKDATFVLNSNIGSEIILRYAKELESEEKLTEDSEIVQMLNTKIQNLLEGSSLAANPFARAEFRGRVDQWVLFFPYKEQHKQMVTRAALASKVLNYYLNEVPASRKMAVGYDDSAVRFLASKYGGDKGDQGFRPIFNEMDKRAHAVLREAWEAGILSAGSGAMLFADSGSLQVTAVSGLGDLDELVAQFDNTSSKPATVQKAKATSNQDLEFGKSGSKESARPPASPPSPSDAAYNEEIQHQVQWQRETEESRSSLTDVNKAYLETVEKLKAEQEKVVQMRAQLEKQEERIKQLEDEQALLLYIGAVLLVAVSATLGMGVLSFMITKMAFNFSTWATLSSIFVVVLGVAYQYFYEVLIFLFHLLLYFIQNFPMVAGGIILLALLCIVLLGGKGRVGLTEAQKAEWKRLQQQVDQLTMNLEVKAVEVEGLRAERETLQAEATKLLQQLDSLRSQTAAEAQGSRGAVRSHSEGEEEGELGSPVSDNG